MQYRIIWTLFLALLVVFASANDQETTIKFFVEEDDEQDKDFIELTLIVRSEEQSLSNAIRKSDGIVDKVKNIANKACEKYADDQQCQDVIEVGNFEIQARYQLIRKVKTFVSFIVTHQVTIKVLNSIPLGNLVDDLLGSGIYKIESMEWNPQDQKDGTVEAFAQALQTGKKLCKDVGQVFEKIVSITEEEQEEEQQQAGGQQQQEEEQQEEQEQEAPTSYQVEVLCVPKPAKQEVATN